MKDALDFLYGFINYEAKTGVPYTGEHYNLDRFREFLDRLGNPEAGLNCIHIAGTKGKGSTAAIIAALLSAHGARTGLFTSPHLISIRERFRINGTAIPETDFITFVSQLEKAVVGKTPAAGYRTTFELMTALAFLYFQSINPDWCVFEVGLGGRLDCTNVINPAVCLMTPVSRDHTESLGGSIDKIAGEKAGIMKPGIPAITGFQIPRVHQVFQSRAEEVGSPLIRRGDRVRIRIHDISLRGTLFSARYRGRWIRDIHLNLAGRVQVENAALALAGLAVLEDQGRITLTDDGIRHALGRVRWPGRLAVLDSGPGRPAHFTGHLITDGAHNPSAVHRLAKSMTTLFPNTPVDVIFAAPASKDVPGMLRAIAPVARRLIVTEYHNARSMKVAELARLARRVHPRVVTTNSLESALTAGMENDKDYHHLLVTGSLYLVGELYELTGGHSAVLDLGLD